MKVSRQAELGLLEKKKLSLPDDMVSDALAKSPNGKASFEQMVSAYKVPLQYRQKVNFRKVIDGIVKIDVREFKNLNTVFEAKYCQAE